MTRGHRERDCSHEVPHSPGPGDRPTRTCRRWSAIPLGSLRAHGSRCAVPPASARIFWACLPRAAPLTWNPSPLSSRLTRFLSCSTMSGSPGTTSRRSSRLTALVSWKSFSGSPLCSLRTLSSLHSSGDRLAPRQPRSATTVVPCLSNDMPTAGGSWTRTSRGKLAPGNHPEDTPSGSTVLTGAFGSSPSSPYSLRRTQSHGFKRRLLGKHGSLPGSPEKATATHSSPLAWKLPWAEEPGRPRSTGSGRVEHDRATSLSLFPSTHRRRPWQPTPVFSPGESQGQGGAWRAAGYGVAQSRTRRKRLSGSRSSSNRVTSEGLRHESRWREDGSCQPSHFWVDLERK